MHEPKHESEDNVKIQALVQIFKQQSYRQQISPKKKMYSLRLHMYRVFIVLTNI